MYVFRGIEEEEEEERWQFHEIFNVGTTDYSVRDRRWRPRTD